MILAGFFVFFLLVMMYNAIKMYRREQHTGMNVQGIYFIAQSFGIVVLSYILCLFLGEIFTFIVLLPVFYFILFAMAWGGWFDLSSYLPQQPPPEPDPNAPRMPIQTPQPHYT